MPRMILSVDRCRRSLDPSEFLSSFALRHRVRDRRHAVRASPGVNEAPVARSPPASRQVRLAHGEGMQPMTVQFIPESMLFFYSSCFTSACRTACTTCRRLSVVASRKIYVTVRFKHDRGFDRPLYLCLCER
jgi:hypothetical protein